MTETDHPPVVTAPALGQLTMHARHGFFGRRGGVSVGACESLNCAFPSADDPTSVEENRGRIARALGGRAANLWMVRQVHGADVHLADRARDGDELPVADALVSRTPGLVLAIQTADCAPILFCDAKAGVAAAAHAGWRGAVGGVIEATLEAMVRLGADPQSTLAAVGPCLMQPSFEVGPDLVEAVLECSPWAEGMFASGAGDRSQFDMQGYIAGRMTRAGVRQTELVAEDTMSQPGVYFSHRRDSRSANPGGARQLSAIMLLP
jgi:polyphenol oxidase